MNINKKIKYKLLPYSKLSLDFAIEVEFQQINQIINLDYCIIGDSSKINFSLSDNSPLWEQTCFELFLLKKDYSYFELNFSPLGKFNIFNFKNYRQNRKNTKQISILKMIFFQNKMNVKLDLQEHQFYKINLSAIIKLKDMNKALSYWSIKHYKQADFHNFKTFSLL